MSGMPIVTISFFSRTFMRWKGISAAVLYFTSRPANSGMASRWATSSAIAASLPATVPLMPSRAMSSVPLMPRPQQKAASGARSSS